MTVMLAVEPVDMRRSFDGLAAMVAQRFAMDARAERMMFVFVNRQHTALKILWSDRQGWFILARRLDEHVLALPRDIPVGAQSVRVDVKALASLLEGIAPRQKETGRDIARAAREAAGKERSRPQNVKLPT